jgi:uncharacterized glyoxalase superfamily protein PhnB
MKMQTYVNFAGNCAEAFRFYEEYLGGKIVMMMTHGQAPDQSQVKAMQETFFATRFGQLRDRFGLNWMIVHERAMPPRP